MSDEHDYKHILGHKGVLKILLRKKSGEAIAAPEEGQRDVSGVLGGAGDDDEIAVAKTPQITFHDLGTRLRSFLGAPPALGPGCYVRNRAVAATEAPRYYGPDDGPAWNEYVEILVDGLAEDFDRIGATRADNTTPLGFQAQVPLALQKQLDDALLGSRLRKAGDPDWRPNDTLDPLALTKANGSGRQVSNCMPLPHKCFSPLNPYSGGFPVDLVLTSVADGAKKETLPCSEVARLPMQYLGDSLVPATSHGYRPLATPAELLDNTRWTARKPKPAKDALEVWNPVNVEGKEAQEHGYMDMKKFKFGSAHVRVNSRLFYESFDTNDRATYKVTLTPYFEGDEVPFKLNTQSSARIYLKPKWLALIPKRTRREVGDFAYKTLLYDWANIGAGDRPFSKISLRLGGIVFVLTNGLDLSGGGIYDPDLLTAIDPSAGGVGIRATQEFATRGSVQYDFSGYSASTTAVKPFLPSGGAAPGDFGTETGLVKVAPGLALNSVVTDPTAPNDATAIAQLVPFVQGSGSFQGQSFAALLSPCIVGRMPAYCRAYSTSWQSSFDYMGHHAADEALAGGVSVLRFRANRFANPNADEQARENAFVRRPSITSREIVIQTYGPYVISSLASIAHLVAACSVSMGGSILYTSLSLGGFGPIHAANLDVMNTLRACVLAVRFHQPSSTGSPLTWTPETVDSDYSTEYIDPFGVRHRLNFDLLLSRNEPAAQLAGIIVQGEKPYYIWRRVAQDNYKFDSMRDQSFVN